MLFLVLWKYWKHIFKKYEIKRNKHQIFISKNNFLSASNVVMLSWKTRNIITWIFYLFCKTDLRKFRIFYVVHSKASGCQKGLLKINFYVSLTYNMLYQDNTGVIHNQEENWKVKIYIVGKNKNYYFLQILINNFELTQLNQSTIGLSQKANGGSPTLRLSIFYCYNTNGLPKKKFRAHLLIYLLWVPETQYWTKKWKTQELELLDFYSSMTPGFRHILKFREGFRILPESRFFFYRFPGTFSSQAQIIA